MTKPATTSATSPHPVYALLDRYAAIFNAAWQRRNQLAGPKLLAEEAAFLPAALSLQETPVHPAPRRTAIAICALFVIALLWSLVGEIDIVAVAPGRIVVSERTKTVQPLEAGVVKAIHVKDGDRVQAGQLLVELDATGPQADGNRVAQERAAAVSEAMRSQALMQGLTAGKAPILSLALSPTAQPEPLSEAERRSAQTQLLSEWADVSAKLAKFDAELAHRHAELATTTQQIEKLQVSLPLVRQREADIQSLTAQGFMAGHAGQDRTRERIELERDLSTAQARQAEAQAAVRESEQGRAAYKAETLRTLRERLTQAELKRSQLTEEATKATQRTQLTQLTAPVAGTVQQLAVHTAGGVVTPAQVLLVVVPMTDDGGTEVTAEVTLENKDVGFVREGQAVTIKLETFPYTRYGTVGAKVSRITADAVMDEKRGALFPATLALDASTLNVDGKTIRLAPGMNLTAEIKTGQRRVIDFLLSPVQRHAGESLRER